jgi:hypothetical protein
VVLPFSTILSIFDQKSYPPFGGFSATSATRQVRRQWFPVGIFPLKLHFGLTGNRPQSAPACSFLRQVQAKRRFLTHFR